MDPHLQYLCRSCVADEVMVGHVPMSQSDPIVYSETVSGVASRWDISYMFIVNEVLDYSPAVDSCDLQPSYLSLPINFRMAEQICMKHGTHITAPEHVSTTYILRRSGQSVCLYVYSRIVARQWLCENVTTATNTRNNRISA